jgi:uncharacterized protein YjbJ (UPF0337 family)
MPDNLGLFVWEHLPTGTLITSTTIDGKAQGMAEYVDKGRNLAEQGKGKAQEVAGRVTNDQSLETKGQMRQTSAKTKKFGERVKDLFRH